MLTSITPLGERGRGQRWALTSAWLLIGHLVGSALLGVVLAVGSRGVAAIVEISDATAIVTIVAVAAAAVGFDAIGWSLPGTRQVDERWLTSYRGWVYGFGFGVQLGSGVVTVVNTALLVAMIVGSLLLPPGQAMLVAVAYGVVRGVGTLAGGRVRSVGDLRRLHMRLDRMESNIRMGALSVVAVASAAALGSVALG